MEIVANYNQDLDTPTHTVLDISVLINLLDEQGGSKTEALKGSGLDLAAMEDQKTLISHRQKLSIFRNVRTLNPDTPIGLIAGQRFRISDFSIFAYALLSSANFGEAIYCGFRNIKLAGPVLKKSFRIENGIAIFEGHNPLNLDKVLPLTAEFWFSSIHSLATQVLGQEIPSRILHFPYPAPSYAADYEKIFGCPVEFDADVLDWQFDASLLDHPLPNANPITAQICAEICDKMLEEFDKKNELIVEIQKKLIAKLGNFPDMEMMAFEFGISPRTFQRRLKEFGTSYQEVLNGLREKLAIEYLETTDLTIEEIAERTGFTEASNFRKAFKKWTNSTPREYR